MVRAHDTHARRRVAPVGAFLHDLPRQCAGLLGPVQADVVLLALHDHGDECVADRVHAVPVHRRVVVTVVGLVVAELAPVVRAQGQVPLPEGCGRVGVRHGEPSIDERAVDERPGRRVDDRVLLPVGDVAPHQVVEEVLDRSIALDGLLVPQHPAA
eukprot:1421173-Prymnesium_polylepis.2